jgi:outer membrane protein OmpA-like peptidoglycan-associated protein
MSEQKKNFQNNALSDVEKFLSLLSELTTIDSDKNEDTQNNGESSNSAFIRIDSQSEDLTRLETRSSSGKITKSVLAKSELDAENVTRSHFVYPFPSLLDELPFLRDIKPIKNGFDDNHGEDRQIAEQDAGELHLSDDTKYSQLEKVEPSRKKEIEAVNLIQALLLISEENQIVSPQIPQSRSVPDSQSISTPVSLPILQPQPQNIYLEKSSDDVALHLLQDILVVPELEELRSFKISVEQKLEIVEKQVNSPDLMNKIQHLESLVQHASIDLNNFGSKLLKIGNEQDNIPTEINHVRKKLAQLEYQINEPAELVKLLLPIIAELISLKADQAREEMCQAITPIIAEVIVERSQFDRVAMSHAIADLLPNAISEQIRNSPDEIAKAIAPEMGAAISEQIRLDRDAIVEALAPEMGAAIKRQIELERDSMVDALYPVIGNTIAKYFAEAIRSINQKVEQTFSVEGMQRKMRAKMQGVSEAELILKESVPFEIQAIFLIHNLSGLVMIDIQRSDLDSLVDPIDSDMLAGMLTAIRSFASECISRSESTTELDAINYSGSKILLEVAGYCYLAVIIHGESDGKLVNKIRDVFGSIIQVHGDRLKEFDGDPSIIPTGVEIELKTLMENEKTKSAKKSPKILIFIGIAVLALIFVPIGIYQYQASRNRNLEAKVLEAFASTPELAVYQLNVKADGDHLKLSGKLPNQYLRDRALQVATEVTKTEIAIGKINNNIYTVNIPADPDLVAIEVQRLTKAFNYTQGVNIQSQFKDGQVTITGQIEQPRMIPKITQTFTKINGITVVNNGATILTPKLSTRIYFASSVTTLQPTDAEKLIEVQAFLDAYPDYNIEIFAKNDNIGDRAVNYQTGMKRAQSVREGLLQRGVNAKRIHISGIIDISSQSPSNQMSRWVEFQPKLKPMSVSN